jgi:predicted kinase
MKKTIIILRGPSGAGKGHYVDTYIRPNAPQIAVCSADDYFTRDGLYEFDAAKLPEAHADCMGKVLQAMTLGHECIVVDNPHTHRWEYQNYVLMGKLAGYEVRIIEIMPQTVEGLKLCADRNRHRVPAKVIATMAMHFEPDSRAIRISVNK